MADWRNRDAAPPAESHGHAAAEKHGHSHGGEACHGHGDAAPPAVDTARLLKVQALLKTLAENGTGGGTPAEAHTAAEPHGHSHGGEPCHGHDEPPAPAAYEGRPSSMPFIPFHVLVAAYVGCVATLCTHWTDHSCGYWSLLIYSGFAALAMFCVPQCALPLLVASISAGLVSLASVDMAIITLSLTIGLVVYLHRPRYLPAHLAGLFPDLRLVDQWSPLKPQLLQCITSAFQGSATTSPEGAPPLQPTLLLMPSLLLGPAAAVYCRCLVLTSSAAAAVYLALLLLLLSSLYSLTISSGTRMLGLGFCWTKQRGAHRALCAIRRSTDSCTPSVLQIPN